MLLLDAATERPRAWLVPVGVSLVVTGLVAAGSWLSPGKYGGTAVSFVFVAATWALVLREPDAEVRAHGLSLSGVLSSEPLAPRRIAGDLSRALLIALAVAAIVIPPFAIGYPLWWSHMVGRPLSWLGRPVLFPARFGEEILGQIFTIALPEEAFYRGYLQTQLDRALPPRLRVLGATVGPSLLVTSAIFALGHVATDPNPARLAVFFPSLLFGWLRQRTGGVGASVLLHATSNLASALLAQNFGLTRR